MSEIQKNTYFRIRLHQVPEDLEDPITQHCFDHGASGVSEALTFVQPDLTYDPRIIIPKIRELDVYFEATPEVSYFDRLTNWNKNIKWTIYEEEQKDWLEEWKKDFKPFELTAPYWIVPSWCESPVDAHHSIRIDPGMAFGTGTHATTKLASHFLAKRAQNIKPGATFLDVGTGTAVLAILAARMGFTNIVGLEIDPEARRVARENVDRNGLSKSVAADSGAHASAASVGAYGASAVSVAAGTSAVSVAAAVDIRDEPLEEHRKTYDVIVANIIDGVLVNLKEPLLKALNLGGDIFVTGILLEREENFNQNFILDPRLEIVRRWQNEEWVGYWLRKVEPRSTE